MDINTAREAVLVDGLADWIGLARVHWRVTQANPGAALEDIQKTTLQLLQELVGDGLFEIGDLTGEGDRFREWPLSLEESIRRVAFDYVDHYDADMWDFACWLNLTDKGTAVAEVLEQRDPTSAP